MEQTIDRNSALRSDTSALASRAEYQAYQILRIGFTVAPIVAGLDKFTHFLTDWTNTCRPWSTIFSEDTDISSCL
jgi:hypothetical protein